MLLARIRSLLRVRNARLELLLRDSTSRALGFEEVRADFGAAAKVALLSNSQVMGDTLAKKLSGHLAPPIMRVDIDHVLSQPAAVPVPDLFVIDGTHDLDGGRGIFRLISDLRSRSETRLSSLLVVLPDNQPDITALVLDLGADDAIHVSVSSGEIGLRAKALIHQKLMNDKLRDTVRDGLQAAVTDPLTGLFNRRYVEPHLTRIANQALVAQREFAVMILDIDHFKSINDRYGHAAGDKVLVEISRRLRENLRSIDLVARIGGEEFMVAMPMTARAQAEAAAERLRRMVSSKPFSLGPDLPMLPVTVSVGVAIGGLTRLSGSEIEAMCNSADAALYAAKNAGRDKVAMSTAA